MKLSEKQKRFCDYYIESLNKYDAALKAGYSETYAKSQSHKLLENVGIKNYLDKQLEKMQSKRIADGTEVMEFLSSSIRGEVKEEIVVTEGTGDGCSEARIMKKQIGAKDRLKAAELLGKRYSLFTEKTTITDAIPVVIVGEDELDE